MEVVSVRNIRLETDRLILRDLQEKDAVFVAKGLAPLSVTRFLAKVPHPYELHHAVDFIKKTNADMQSEKREGYPLAITLKPEMCLA
jgi:RimJ/RimL family protein N-acetyltransferase